jgi:hypothetical protein
VGIKAESRSDVIIVISLEESKTRIVIFVDVWAAYFYTKFISMILLRHMFFHCLILVWSFSLNAQTNLLLTLSNTTTPGPPFAGTPLQTSALFEMLAQNSDVEVFNRSFIAFGRVSSDTGGTYGIQPTSNLYGKFRFNGPSDIGIDSGIVIATGRPATFSSTGLYPGIARPASFTSSGYNPGAPSAIQWWATNDNYQRRTQYPQLVALNNGDSIIDPVIMDFFFVPKGNSIRLEYVFASEEYPENACNPFNDVMGIFLSKPGQPGYQNIAVVPGTSTPVGINTINNGGGDCQEPQNQQYYVDNLGNNGQNVVYDGFTTVLTASAEVMPCDTYHLRIAIADGARHDNCLFEPDTIQGYDNASWHPCRSFFDSGLFIKAGSLRSTDNLWVEALGGSAESPATPYAIRGGCMQGKFRLYRQHSVNAPLTVNYVLGGTAQAGIDFQPLSGTATIAPWQSYVDIPLQAIGSGAEREVSIYLLSPYNNCGTTAVDTLSSAQMTIYPSLPVHILTNDTTICAGCSVQIMTATPDSGLQYQWVPATGLDNAASQTPWATPALSTLYKLMATAEGTNCTATDSVWIRIETSSVEEMGTANNIMLLPNPFNKFLQLVSANQKDHHRLQLFDILGRCILQSEGTVQKLNDQLMKVVSGLPTGGYVARIVSDKNQRIINLVKRD